MSNSENSENKTGMKCAGFWIPIEIVNLRTQKVINSNELIILGIVSGMTSSVGKKCWISNETLATIFGTNERNIRKILRRLQELQLLFKEQVTKKNGKTKRYLRTIWSDISANIDKSHPLYEKFQTNAIDPEDYEDDTEELNSKKEDDKNDIEDDNSVWDEGEGDLDPYTDLQRSKKTGKAVQKDLPKRSKKTSYSISDNIEDEISMSPDAVRQDDQDVMDVIDVIQSTESIFNILSKKLHTALKLNRKIDNRSKIHSWENEFRQLSEDRDIKEIEVVLEWYINNMDYDEYIPQAFCAKSFRKKFIAIESKMNKIKNSKERTNFKLGSKNNRLPEDQQW